MHEYLCQRPFLHTSPAQRLHMMLGSNRAVAASARARRTSRSEVMPHLHQRLSLLPDELMTINDVPARERMNMFTTAQKDGGRSIDTQHCLHHLLIKWRVTIYQGYYIKLKPPKKFRVN